MLIGFLYPRETACYNLLMRPSPLVIPKCRFYVPESDGPAAYVHTAGIIESNVLKLQRRCLNWARTEPLDQKKVNEDLCAVEKRTTER